MATGSAWIPSRTRSLLTAWRRGEIARGSYGSFGRALLRRGPSPLSVQAAPLVSVVTPVYNGGKYLRECIESVIAQSYTNWRYTIVNNRSTDDSLEIALHYASLDSRVRVRDNVEFLPIIDNHNQAISLIDADSIFCKPLT